MELVFQTAVNSGIQSVFYALMAIGFTLIFGVMGVLNFAHGELYMLGAYAVWLTYGKDLVPFPVSIMIATAIIIVIGLGFERGLFRPMRSTPTMGIIVSIGMIFILQVIAATTWHVGLMKHVPPYIKGSLEILGATAPWQRLVLIPAAASLLGVLWFFIRRVRLGRALRAVAQDPDAAALQGISIDRIRLLAMGISAGLAGIAGALMSPVMRVDPYMGHPALIVAFMVTVVGGLGSIEGALVASIIYGFLIAFMQTFVDGTMATIAGVILMAIMLTVRPRGLFGRA